MDISPFIKSQAASLREMNVAVEFFFIRGKGLMAYWKSAKKLRKYLRSNSVDIIHAHYGLSGWTAVLSGTKKPIVLSIMGSDILGEYKTATTISHKSRIVKILTQSVQFFVDSIISKAENIHHKLIRKRISHIIPNGIDLESVYFQDKASCREELGLKKDKKYILFVGKTTSFWKNFALAKETIELLNNDQIELLYSYPMSHEKVVKYLNAADVLIHTSFMEGSPNVIKEAMACNLPIVATNVGDIEWVFGDTEGCFITSFEVEEVVEAINKALDFVRHTGRTNGAERIKSLGLDTKSTAEKIIELYKKQIPSSNIYQNDSH